MTSTERRQKFSVVLDEELAEWVRAERKVHHRTINGQIVYLLERAREFELLREAAR